MGIELAQKACELSAWQDWSCLTTLAAAHAETGQLEQAVDYATKALALAPEEEAAACRELLERYRAMQPE